MNFQAWKNGAIGRHINVDGQFGDQCVDVAMDYVQFLFHKPWNVVLGYGNAKDLYGASSSAYFQKILNNHNDPNQLPKQGDLVVYGGHDGNPYGHIGVCDSASPKGVNLIQQDGFNPAGACFEALHGWANCIGWLRPRVSFAAKVVQKVAPKPAPAQFYIVHAGDTVSAICPRFRISLTTFKRLNPGVKDINRIQVGEKLRVR